MESELYALIHWEDEIRFIVSCDKIVQPRKDPWLYEEGEYITAKYYGTQYRAVISQISADKQLLTERKKLKYALKYSYDATKDPKKSAAPLPELEHELEPVMNVLAAIDMPQKAQSSRKKTMTKSSSKTQTTKPLSQAQAKKRAYIEMGCQSSDSDDDILSIQAISEVNSKGYATVAKKQPRRTSGPFLPTLPPNELPLPINESSIVQPEQVPVLAALMAPVPTAKHSQMPEETIQCISCSLMAARVKFLEEQLEKFEKQTEECSSNEIHQITVPKPGVYPEAIALENQMERLIDGHSVFLYGYQKEIAVRKGKGEEKDGKKIARYLIPIFFTKAERLDGTITRSGGGLLHKLNEQIIEAILGIEQLLKPSKYFANCCSCHSKEYSKMREFS